MFIWQESEEFHDLFKDKFHRKDAVVEEMQLTENTYFSVDIF